MGILQKLLALRSMKVFSLLVVFIAASTLLILINYFTIRITSAVRAYINGESQYSKGQKDAARNLILFLETEDTVYWNGFRKELNVPIGDSIARTELMEDGQREIVKKGFLQGRNNQEDLDEMVWLFRNFKDISFFKEAIAIWKQGDHLIGQANQLGNEAHRKVKEGTLTSTERSLLIEKINVNTTRLTRLEVAFSEVLGAAARKINSYLFYVNLLMTLFIVGSVSGYAAIMFKRLKETNQDLVMINRELDRFVYSASHDLKAPISSMKGLIDLTLGERDPVKIQNYLDLMKNSLNRQEHFIKEIINFSRNKKTQINKEPVSLSKIIDQAILQHHYMPGGSGIHIDQEINLDVIQSDPLRLEIIINNILSNAIKYSDDTKSEKQIFIKTFRKDHHCIFEFIDNGVGIDKSHLNRIFDLFYVVDHDHKGSGLGLYIVKDTVGKLNGTVRVESTRGLGTKFIVIIPG